MPNNEKRGRGRPTKEGAKRPGELSDGLCRFTVITNREIVDAVKAIANAAGVSVKDTVAFLLRDINSQSEEGKIRRRIIVADLKDNSKNEKYKATSKAKRKR